MDEGAYEVVIAAYGRSPFLHATLESAVAHLPESVPVTVLDDCSPDDTVARIAEGFAPRVGLRRNRVNLGTSGSFNRAMRLSRSAYTVLVGPDDLVLPDAHDAYSRAIRLGTRAGAVHPGVRVIDENGVPANPLPDRVKSLLRPGPGIHREEDLAVRLLLGNWTYNPAIAWRTDLVDDLPFDESLRTAMDLDRLLRLAVAGGELLLTEPPALAYRRHSGAVSSTNRGLQRMGEEMGIHARQIPRMRRLGWTTAIAAAELAPTVRAHGVQTALVGAGGSSTDRLAVVRSTLRRVSAAATPG